MKCPYCNKETVEIYKYWGREIELTPIESFTKKIGDLKVPKGWNMITFGLFEKLREQGWNKENKNVVLKNLKENYKSGYSHAIARFFAYIVKVRFDCDWDVGYSSPWLGVAFWRWKEKVE